MQGELSLMVQRTVILDDSDIALGQEDQMRCSTGRLLALLAEQLRMQDYR